jgi:hypothetical protein
MPPRSGATAGSDFCHHFKTRVSGTPQTFRFIGLSKSSTKTIIPINAPITKPPITPSTRASQLSFAISQYAPPAAGKAIIEIRPTMNLFDVKNRCSGVADFEWRA